MNGFGLFLKTAATRPLYALTIFATIPSSSLKTISFINGADIFTHTLGGRELLSHLKRLGYVIR